MIGYSARLRHLLLAGLLGWFAGFVVSSPAMVVVGWRDSEHELSTFLISTGFGLLAWAGWTLLLGLAAWLLIAVPCAVLIRPAFLVRYRRIVLTLTAITTISVVLQKMRLFQDYAASHIVFRFTLYMPYGLFAIFFAVVTAWWYIRRLSAGSAGRLQAQARLH